jgi:hypothetical protein
MSGLGATRFASSFGVIAAVVKTTLYRIDASSASQSFGICRTTVRICARSSTTTLAV